MIVQVRGTSGSGKSWVIRQVMDYLGEWDAVYRAGRKQPLCHVQPDWGVTILGHYNTPTGGCDTVGSARAVYELIQEVWKEQPRASILCEGLLLSEDTKWSLQLPDLRVVFLTTPLEQCLEQIGQRRRAAGNEKPLDAAKLPGRTPLPEKTATRKRLIDRAHGKLLAAGVMCRRVSASQAPRVILRWLKTPVE